MEKCRETDFKPPSQERAFHFKMHEAVAVKGLHIIIQYLRHLFLTVLEAGKSKIKGPVDSVPGESSPWLAEGCLLVVFTWCGEGALVFPPFLIRTLIPS